MEVAVSSMLLLPIVKFKILKLLSFARYVTKSGGKEREKNKRKEEG